jgi:hypothetical protein
MPRIEIRRKSKANAHAANRVTAFARQRILATTRIMMTAALSKKKESHPIQHVGWLALHQESNDRK